MRYWFSRLTNQRLERKFADTLKVLEDMSEEEILARENEMGVSIRRPTEKERAAWKDKKLKLGLK